jgi:hypothetical protein
MSREGKDCSQKIRKGFSKNTKSPCSLHYRRIYLTNRNGGKTFYCCTCCFSQVGYSDLERDCGFSGKPGKAKLIDIGY